MRERPFELENIKPGLGKSHTRKTHISKTDSYQNFDKNIKKNLNLRKIRKTLEICRKNYGILWKNIAKFKKTLIKFPKKQPV